MRYIVTGASRGIGIETAKTLVEAGHEVYALTRQVNTVPVPGIKYVHFALSSDSSNLDELMDELGEVNFDGVVLNAGILMNQSFENTKVEDIQEMFQVNVFAPMAFLKRLKPRLNPGAHIINIGSMGGVQGSAKFPGLAWYSASKGAIAILTECLAEEWKNDGVSVNCLALGAVQTEMLQAAFPGYQAPLNPEQMGGFIANFLQTGHQFFNGKILPVSVSTP